jgi:hypothetical protein
MCVHYSHVGNLLTAFLCVCVLHPPVHNRKHVGMRAPQRAFGSQLSSSSCQGFISCCVDADVFAAADVNLWGVDYEQ